MEFSSWLEFPDCIPTVLHCLVAEFAWGSTHPTKQDWSNALEAEGKLGDDNCSLIQHLAIVEWSVANDKCDQAKTICWAAWCNNLVVVQYLVEEAGFLPLNHALRDAVDRSHLEVTQYLVERGATNLHNNYWHARIWTPSATDIIDCLANVMTARGIEFT